MSLGVRKPYVAGQFYELHAENLQNFINKAVESELNEKQTHKPVRALILPHAGYSFSAQTAIKALLKATEEKYSKVLVIAPSHRLPFEGIAISELETYRTPLGDIPVDMDSVLNIANKQNDYIANLPEAHTSEHSLEVQLPLLQHFFSDFELIPIINGLINESSAREIASSLKDYWQEDILWVISSDFTHYGRNFSYLPFTEDIKENINKLDLGAIELILQKDLHAFCKYLDKTGATICGRGAIEILLAVLELVDADNKLGSELVSHTTSGELTGDYSHCVSYAGITFFDNKTTNK
jgi:AmmeMemoRadiSam system protein B